MLSTFFKTFDLADDILLLMVNHSQKSSFDPMLKVWMFNPFAQISPPKANFLELFKLDIFDELG